MDKITTRLSDEQIEQLFLFTKKKLVHFYDLQVELVDHLATCIEEEMNAEPSLPFETALQKVYNRFGIFGFAKVVQQRSEALVKSNNRIWLSAVRKFFTIPKVAFTAAIFLGSLFLGEFLSPQVKGGIVFALWLGFTIPLMASFFRSKRNEAKKLLLTQYSPYSYFSSFWIPYTVFVIGAGEIKNNIAFAIFIVVIIVAESAVIQVNSRVQKKAREWYPEAFKIV